MPNTIDSFLEAVSKQRSRDFTISYWPLSPVQTNPYFEAEQALDIYNTISELKKTKTDKEIGQFFGYPAVLRNFMLNSGIVGLKTACKVGLASISTEERVSYVEHLIKILGTMVKNDPLCLDGKSLIYSDAQVKQVLEKDFIVVNSQNRQKIIASYLAFWSWCWAIYYNAFCDLGFEIHGPYSLGEEKSLVVREFHHIKNLPFWEVSKKIPFGKITFYQIYNSTDLTLSFNNILTTSHPYGLGNLLEKVRVEADGKELNEQEIIDLGEQVFSFVVEQNAYIKNLSPLVLLKKAAEFTAFSLRDLYEAVGREPTGEKYVEANLKRFGKRFLEQYSKIAHQDEEYIKKIYDPRNDLLAEDIQTI